MSAVVSINTFTRGDTHRDDILKTVRTRLPLRRVHFQASQGTGITKR
jgi:hypothetical protein